MNELFHVGVGKLKGAPGRGSGRYPLGSGKRPYQDYGGGKQTNKQRAKGMSDEELQKEVKRLNLEKNYVKLKGGDPDTLADARDIANESSNALNRVKNSIRQNNQQGSTWSRMDLSDMTDQQLRDAINRENLEIQYSKMFNTKKPEIKKGQVYAEKILDVSGDVLAIAGSALAIAVSIKALRNKNND